jgi:hypothetical protein
LPYEAKPADGCIRFDLFAYFESFAILCLPRNSKRNAR